MNVLCKSFPMVTSNGGCRREEKSCKHWSNLASMSLVTANLFFCYIKSRAIVYIDCTENQRKIGLSQIS